MVETKIAGFTLIGVELGKKTSNEAGQSSIDCGMLWQKFEKENFVQRIPSPSTSEVYAVYYNYEGDHTRPFSYFIGCKVEPGTEVPDGMASLLIPEGHYMKVTTKGQMPDCVANAWKDIWISKLDRRYSYDFELYDPRSKDWSNAEVEIFISCNKRI